MMRELDAQLLQMPNAPSLAALPPNHDVRHLVRQALFTAAESADRQRTPLLMSQKIVQLLYKAVSQLGRDVYVAILDQLCHSFEEVGKEVVNWLLYADDEVCVDFHWLNPSSMLSQRKFNVAVTATLLRSGLINITLEDQQLAQSLYMDPRPTLQSYVAGLIRDCLSNNPPIASQAQFAHSTEALRQLAQSGKCVEE
jgi:CCR4-NOT transcription complex subunit 1